MIGCMEDFTLSFIIIQPPMVDSIDLLALTSCICFHSDAVRKVFIQLAQSSFAGLPNLVKTAKVEIIQEFDSDR